MIDEALRRAGQVRVHHLQVMSPRHLAEVEPTLPALVLDVRGRAAAEAAKQALLRHYPPGHRVKVLPRSGTTGAGTRTVALDRMERARPFHEQADIFVPPLPEEEGSTSLRALRKLVAHLRARCPWDRQQTLSSLAPFAVEEAYEVAEAIADGEVAQLRQELGDLLLQVLMQAQVASETNQFDLTGIMRDLGTKLVRRHPHVFGQARAESAGEVLKRWEQLKAEERGGQESILTGVLKSQPALRRAQELQRRVSRVGFDWPTRAGAEAKLREEMRELLEASGRDQVSLELGDVLFMLAKLGLSWQVDAEMALRGTNDRFASRFRYLERRLRERGQPMDQTPLSRLLELWEEAKSAEQEGVRGRESGAPDSAS